MHYLLSLFVASPLGIEASPLSIEASPLGIEV